MQQRDHLKGIILRLFHDKELKKYMDIPEKDFNNLVAFRDKYCISSFGTTEFVNSSIPCRLLVYWDNMSHTNNHRVTVRPLIIEIWVQKSSVYGVTKNALDRRQDLIADRLKLLLCSDKINHFIFEFDNMGDLNSNTQDYIRFFIKFDSKYINF